MLTLIMLMRQNIRVRIDLLLQKVRPNMEVNFCQNNVCLDFSFMFIFYRFQYYLAQIM